MADDSDEREDERDEPEGAEDKGPFASIDKQCKKHLIFSLLLLVANFILLGGGIVGMASLYQELVANESELPFNKADELLTRIEAGSGIVTAQYSPYMSKMEDELISDIYTSYGTMYNVTQGGENEYRDAMLIYKDSIFSIARNVRGSGVWYEFYSSDILGFVQKSKKRSVKLDQYGVPDE